MPRHRVLLSLVVPLLLCNAFSNIAHAIPDTRPVKWNVVRVRPVYHEKTRKTFDELSNLFRSLAEALERKGSAADIVGQFQRISAYYHNQAVSPRYGSGWIYRPEDSSAVFVVTSKYIAGEAASVQLEFEGQEQRPAPITDTSVIYTDPRHDIAIIEILPESLARQPLPKECTGFELAALRPTEGQQVWSAGFPSYGDSAVFALTPGHVSSAAVPNEDGVKYIVHTATANQGNSGGPLLIELGAATRRPSSNAVDVPLFGVAGMNEWQMADSTNVNFAIPEEVLRGAIAAAQAARSITRSSGRLGDTLLASAKQLASELGSSRPDMSVLNAMVSYTFVAERPQVMKADLLRLLQGDMTKEESKRFEASPVDYSRETLLRLFRETFATGKSDIGAVTFESISIEDLAAKKSQVRSIYTVAGKRQEISWTWEHGAWRIANASFDRTFQSKLKATDDALRAFGVIIDVASSAVYSPSSKKPGAGDSDSIATPATPVVHRGRGYSLMVWASQGRRGAAGDNFQGSLEQKNLSVFGFELAFPFNSYFWFGTGLGYGPLGVAYERAENDRTVLIDEHPTYLQLPILFRFELPVETRYLTLRLSGKAGLAGDLLLQRDGTSRDTMTGAVVTLDDWFTKHTPGNVAVLYGGGIEIGLGPSPSVYVGAEVVSEQHLLKEWSTDAFGGANYRYNMIRWGAFVKYQSLR